MEKPAIVYCQVKCHAILSFRGGVNGTCTWSSYTASEHYTLPSYAASEHYSALYISVIQCCCYISLVSIKHVFIVQLVAVVSS